MKRALLIASITLAVLAAAAGLAYAIGVARISDTASELAAQAGAAAPAPVAATAPAEAPAVDAGAPAATPNSGGAGPAAAYGAAVATQEVPPPDPNSPFAKDIPGCICHSDDPAQVESHAAYRMNQCSGCHQGSVPTGQ